MSGKLRRIVRRVGSVGCAVKTGSINNRNNTARYDWFVGYAAQKAGDQQLAVCVMVAHEDYIGTRATAYARLAFKRYFANLPQPKILAASP